MLTAVLKSLGGLLPSARTFATLGRGRRRKPTDTFKQPSAPASNPPADNSPEHVEAEEVPHQEPENQGKEKKPQKPKKTHPMTDVWKRVQQMGGEKPGRNMPRLDFMHPDLMKSPNVGVFGKGGRALNATAVAELPEKGRKEKEEIKEEGEKSSKRYRRGQEKDGEEEKKKKTTRKAKSKEKEKKVYRPVHAEDITNQLVPQSPKLGPMEVPVANSNKHYYWCSCGLSGKQPFCDGKHFGTKFKPLKFAVLEKRPKVFLCGCKLTTLAPFCDGQTCADIKESLKTGKLPEREPVVPKPTPQELYDRASELTERLKEQEEKYQKALEEMQKQNPERSIKELRLELDERMQRQSSGEVKENEGAK